MEEHVENLRRRGRGMGVFDGYQMFGFRFANDAGRDGWLITVWVTGHDPVKNYWLEGGGFTKPHVLYGDDFNFIRLERFEDVTDIDDKKKAAIFKAIAEWEEANLT